MTPADDDYYAEIAIEIDGWTWNLKDRSRPLFPSAERLLRQWERDKAKRVA